MTPKEQAITALQEWYNTLKPQSLNQGFPAKGTMIGSLHVLHRLQERFSLEIGDHLAKKHTQITGLTESGIPRLLKLYGEERGFIKVARTNRGLVQDMEDMLNVLKRVDWNSITHPERYAILEELKGFIMARIRDFLDQEGLKIASDISKSTWSSVRDLLEKARESGKAGPVAQYLVGAKLQQRFPNLHIGNESYSTADAQLGRPGDFLIGDTVFHVTVRPLGAVYKKCVQNINSGLRPYLLVPDPLVLVVRQKAEQLAPDKITVISIESFVSQNIEEISEFSTEKIAKEFYEMLRLYNERVDATENDKSMLVELAEGSILYSDEQVVAVAESDS
ncbi:MAG: DUF4928 family protein [Armatimonadetes bacterium]|nr:DUF4928 family protein [Armatimonadota bacterium]